MTPDERFQIILWALGVVGAVISALIIMGIRAVWGLSATLQEDRDATKANTTAIVDLKTSMTALSGRVDNLAARTGRR